MDPNIYSSTSLIIQVKANKMYGISVAMKQIYGIIFENKMLFKSLEAIMKHFNQIHVYSDCSQKLVI